MRVGCVPAAGPGCSERPGRGTVRSRTVFCAPSPAQDGWQAGRDSITPTPRPPGGPGPWPGEPSDESD
eukprot:746522-Hanusia_phi.AAC.11